MTPAELLKAVRGLCASARQLAADLTTHPLSGPYEAAVQDLVTRAIAVERNLTALTQAADPRVTDALGDVEGAVTRLREALARRG